MCKFSFDLLSHNEIASLDGEGQAADNLLVTVIFFFFFLPHCNMIVVYMCVWEINSVC